MFCDGDLTEWKVIVGTSLLNSVYRVTLMLKTAGRGYDGVLFFCNALPFLPFPDILSSISIFLDSRPSLTWFLRVLIQKVMGSI